MKQMKIEGSVLSPEPWHAMAIAPQCCPMLSPCHCPTAQQCPYQEDGMPSTALREIALLKDFQFKDV